MMAGQARSSAVIMALDTHMILEAVPVSCLPRRTAHRAINRSSRHYAEAVPAAQPAGLQGSTGQVARRFNPPAVSGLS